MAGKELEKNNHDSYIRAVGRALQILKCFGRQREMTLSQISKAVSLPKTTTLRLLNTLEAEDFITHSGDFTYRLSILLMHLGNSVEGNIDIIKLSQPTMQQLSELTCETVTLNIVANHRRLCIAQREGKHELRQFINIGELLPLHKGASGKVLLAFMNAADQEQVIQALPPDTNHDQLRQELATIRRQGYAHTIGDRAKGATAISAPILGKNRQLVAGLSISGAIYRFTHQVAEQYIEYVVKAARELSHLIGYLDESE